MAGVKGRSGGKREGAGGVKQIKTISESAKRRWESAARAFRKRHGMTVEEYTLELMAQEGVQHSVKVACAKLYSEALIAKETESTVRVQKSIGPEIRPVRLPPRNEDPALKVLQGGK